MDRPRNICATRLRLLHAALASLAVLLLVGLGVVSAVAGRVSAGSGSGGKRAPDVGEYTKLNVDAGHKVAFSACAEGVQIYRWNGASWDFFFPEAVLYANDGGKSIVGIHYGGPTWESNSGSKVVGTVQERATVDPDAIPWLKLSGKGEGPASSRTSRSSSG